MNSQTFFIQGAVNRPGAYQIEGRPSLLTLIALAGGLTENYGSTAFIIREAYRPKMDVPDKGDPKGSLESQPESVAAGSPSQPGDRNQEAEGTARYALIQVNIKVQLQGVFVKQMR